MPHTTKRKDLIKKISYLWWRVTNAKLLKDEKTRDLVYDYCWSDWCLSDHNDKRTQRSIRWIQNYDIWWNKHHRKVQQ